MYIWLSIRHFLKERLHWFMLKITGGLENYWEYKKLSQVTWKAKIWIYFNWKLSSWANSIAHTCKLFVVGNASQKFLNTLGNLDWRKSHWDKLFLTGNIEFQATFSLRSIFKIIFLSKRVFEWCSDTGV